MRWLLRLYPRAWRERYEEEMLAVLENHGVRLVTVIDLLFGALDAYLNYTGVSEGMMSVVEKLRTRVIMVFCGFVVYGLGWSMLQRFTDPFPLYETVAKVYPEFDICFRVLFGVGCLAFLAVVLSGIPILYFALRRAVQNRQAGVLRPFGVAVGCLLLFLGLTAALALFHPYGVSLMYCILVYLIICLLLLIIGTTAVSLVVRRTEFAQSELRFTTLAEVLVLLCMLVSVVASVLLIVFIHLDAPRLLMTQDVNLPMFVIGIALMVIGAFIAGFGLKKGAETRQSIGTSQL